MRWERLIIRNAADEAILKKNHCPSQRDQGSSKDASASKKYIQAPSQRKMGKYAQSGDYWFLSYCSISQNV